MREKLRTRAVQDYLKTIYLLQSRSGRPVSTSDLAEQLDVRAASVSGMLQRLEGEGLLQHTRYHGARLTAKGRRVAVAVVRRHRLVETFLVEELGMGWEEVHAEAEALEHAISDRLLDLMAKKLGDPARDPHGDPIPSALFEVDEKGTLLALGGLPVGARGRLVRVMDADPEILTYLDELGISLGDEVEVHGLAPFGGPIDVSFSGQRRSLGRQAAAVLGVEVS
jgi:DtxR family transcriptional regulator, Mn-dependent transcriptional regulator